MVLKNCLLHRIQLPVAAHALDGDHVPAVHRRSRHQTGRNCLAVHNHGTGTALTDSAAFLGTGQAQVVSQHIQKPLVGFYLHLAGLSV